MSLEGLKYYGSCILQGVLNGLLGGAIAVAAVAGAAWIAWAIMFLLQVGSSLP